MLTAAENERLTRVGPSTPAGEWLRRFWHPFALSDRWEGIKTLWRCEEPVAFKGQTLTAGEWGRKLATFEGQPTPVRLLGEDLILFRDGSGRPGLFGLRCPHRGASMQYGRVRPDGLECCYHGWRFDVAGRCVDMPAEPPEGSFKDKVTILAYPVRELGGFLWAYLGPGEPPILPRLDVVVREDGVRAVENFGLWGCNYFQILENSPDNTHTAILHGGAGGERADIWGREIPQMTWTEDDYGIVCHARRQDYDRYSHILLPTTNRLPQPWPGGRFKWPRGSAIFRTPVDDTHTLVLSAVFTPHRDGRPPDLPPGATFDITDQLHVHRLQDYEAVVSQGEIFDRTTERLGSTDRGVILLRKLVFEGIAAVERGEDPKGCWRDPARDVLLDFEHEVTDSLLVT